MTFSLGDLLLSQGRNRCGGKQQAASEKSLHRNQEKRTLPPGFSRCSKACLLLLNHSSHQPNSKPRIRPFNQTKAAIWYSDSPNFPLIQKKTF